MESFTASICRAESGYFVETITTIGELRAMEEDWHDLARSIPSPLAQFEWFLSAAEAFSGEDLFVVAVRQGQRLQAIAPLVLRRRGVFHQLEVLGHQLNEPQGLIFRDEPSLDALISHLLRSPFPLVLRKLSAGGAECAAFARVSARGVRLVTGMDSRASVVPLSGGPSGLAERVSGKRRRSMRKALRVAQALGSVSFQIVHPRPDLLDPLLDEVFRVEASGWKARAGTALERDEAVGKFFRRYAARAARLGILRLGFMRIGEAVAAVRLDVEWGQRSWDLKIGYDERFADCSPGLLLSHEALLHSASRGLEAHHFLGEYEPWHDCWDAEQSPRSTLRHYGLSAAGSVALAGDAASRLRGKLGAFWLNRRVTPVMGGMQIVQELPLPI